MKQDSRRTHGGSRERRQPDSETTTRPGIRTVLGVAVLFSILGGLMVRLAVMRTTPQLGAILATGLALIGATAAVAVFGRGAVKTATEQGWP